MDEFIYRNREELLAKLYVPDDDTLPIPLKYVKVTRHTKTHINNLSKMYSEDLRFQKNKSLPPRIDQELRDSRSQGRRYQEGYNCVSVDQERHKISQHVGLNLKTNLQNTEIQIYFLLERSSGARYKDLFERQESLR